MIRTNSPTLYELVAAHPDGRACLVAYCSRKGRRDIWIAVTKNDSRREAIINLTGAKDIHFAKRSADGARMGDWLIKFSGRTQRDCQRSELPFVCDVAAPLVVTETDEELLAALK